MALALRRAELELLAERFGEQPILLIDDFSAELDPGRRAFLLELAAGVPQAIVTGTERPPGASAQFWAQAGRFTPVDLSPLNALDADDSAEDELAALPLEVR